MKIEKIKEILNAKVICGDEYLDREVYSACGSDLMSDVLAFVKEQGVLLTGLLNPQAIRTAEMMDIICVVFVRGKSPDETMKKLADEHQLTVLCTEHPMYQACGLLYKNGLCGKE
ncbi:MAG: DRTGG domain-containing protein [Bacillota bacterium]|nr:DRTGG domain-containing protein [Bacillota bacterium]